MLSAINLNVQKLVDANNKYGIPIDTGDSLNKLQDSTGANPKEFTLKAGVYSQPSPQEHRFNNLKGGPFQIITEKELHTAPGNPRNLKKNTPSFGEMDVIAQQNNSNTKIKGKIILQKKDEFKAGESDNAKGGINSIFSSDQIDDDSKEMIIESIEISDAIPHKSKTFCESSISESEVNISLNKEKNSASGRSKQPGKKQQQQKNSSRRNTENKRKILLPGNMIKIGKKYKKNKNEASRPLSHLDQDRSWDTSRYSNKMEGCHSFDCLPLSSRSKPPGSSRKREQYEVNSKQIPKSLNFRFLPNQRPHQGVSDEFCHLKDQETSKIITSSSQKQLKKHLHSRIECLPANCIVLISEYTGEILPPLIFCSKELLGNYAIAKGQEYEIKIKLLEEQYNEIVLYNIFDFLLGSEYPFHTR